MSFKPMLTVALSITLLSSPVFASYLKVPSVSRNPDGKTELVYFNNNFQVINQGKAQTIPKYNMDSSLRKMNEEKLIKMIEFGYIDVKKMSDGQFALRYYVRGNGGGLHTDVIGSSNTPRI